MVHPADIQDRDGGVLLLSTLFGMCPFLAKLFADAGYQGPQFATAVAEVLPHLSIRDTFGPGERLCGPAAALGSAAAAAAAAGNALAFLQLASSDRDQSNQKLLWQ